MTRPRCGPSRTIISKQITEISAEDVKLNHHLYALLGAMPLLFLSETIEGTRSLFSTELFLAAGALGLVSNLGAGYLYNSITRSNTPLVASVAIMIVPLLSSFMGAFYYAEALDFAKVAMAVIVVSLGWVVIQKQHQLAAAKAATPTASRTSAAD